MPGWNRFVGGMRLFSHKSLHGFKTGLTPVGDNNNNRYGVEERARKQALPFIENKTAQAEPVHYRLNNNN